MEYNKYGLKMSQVSGKISSQYLNIRNQNKNEILEDYVEAILEISKLKGDVKNADLAEHFGVSQATINKNLKRLINFNTLATSLYEYSSDELFELGSLHAFTIIIFLSIAIYFFDSFLEKKIVLKDKK